MRSTSFLSASVIGWVCLYHDSHPVLEDSFWALRKGVGERGFEILLGWEPVNREILVENKICKFTLNTPALYLLGA